MDTWSEMMNLRASQTHDAPAEVAVGDRVADVYADSEGEVTGFEGNGVIVKWDDHQPEDDQLPLPERSDLRRL